jgi:hypothetical protein|nr:MAG TPA: hypothetical protein [Caudoviricetes sp.]
MYTDEEIREKQQFARAAGLGGAELLDDAEAVKKDCNGIGAEWMPDRWRDRLGERYPELVVVADTHDRRYALGGGILARWRADWEFLRNGLKMARHCRRIGIAWATVRMWILLRLGGAAAFNWER